MRHLKKCIIPSHQVTRLLMAVEQGCVNKWRGQSLQDINIGNCIHKKLHLI